MSDLSCSSEASRKAADKLSATAGYVYFETIGLSAALIGYGILTFIFGDALWTIGTVGVYDSADQVPFAPESWGMAFVVAGLGMALGNINGRWNRLLALSAMVAGFLFLFFSVSFFIDAIGGVKPSWPPAMIYCILATLCVNRARLAWLWRSESD